MESDEEEVDDDDLEMLRENLGDDAATILDGKKKYKRLKRAVESDEDDGKCFALHS